MILVPVSLVACGQHDQSAPRAGAPRAGSGDAVATPGAAPPATADRADATTPVPLTGAGFAIRLVGSSDAGMPVDYSDPAWQELVATASLGPVFVDDDAIEAVFTDPLTLVLAVDHTPPPAMDQPFVATLGGERLFAGSVVFVASARARAYPVIHVQDRTVAVYVQILPQIGASADTPLTAPPALLAHFRGRGVLAASGAAAAPRYTRRRFVAAVTNTKPGDPTSQVEATCDAAGACTVTVSFRRPGSDRGKWDSTETHALPLAEFDAVWTLVESMNLFRLDPKPPAGRVPRVIHPPKYRVAVEAERPGGATHSNDRAWQSPSTVDASIQHYLRAAGELGRRHATSVPVNYFPEP